MASRRSMRPRGSHARRRRAICSFRSLRCWRGGTRGASCLAASRWAAMPRWRRCGWRRRASLGASWRGRAGRAATAAFALEQGPGALFDRDAPKLFSNRIITHHPGIVAQARALAEANSAVGLAAQARGMALRPDATALLPQIACPALALVGDQDSITPISDARTLFERIPNARLAIIEDAGHLANLERPQLFTDPVARFLREQVGAHERR